MNNNIITIGTALKWRGIFDEKKTYYRDNIVLDAGCLFRCNVLQIQGHPPVQIIDESGHFKFINKDVWDVILDMSAYYNKIADIEHYVGETMESYNTLQEALENLTSKISTLKSDITSVSQKASAIGILPFDGLWPSVGTPWPTRGVWFNPATDTKAAYWSLMSLDNGFTSDDYNETDTENEQIARTNCIYRCGSQFFRIIDGQLAEIGGVTINDDTIITLTTDNI